MENQTQEKILIKKDMLLSDVIEKYPEVAVILTGYGLHCVGCHFSNFDTIEAGAKIHGLNNEEIKFMLKDINTIALEKSKED
jgi:hybrid cluster-associated redox disulfide protein|tara:strand:- start:7167 stop:7412 length:246 start_codon:yes stop_codon:yes gene_type:complete